MRTVVIYNPQAGRGRCEKLLKAASHWLPENSVYRPTSFRGHAAMLAAKAIEEGFERVIAAGGDGTVNEVLQGFMKFQQPQAIFSTWPLGSSNDYARTIGMKQWWKKRGRTELAIMPVDVGKLTYDQNETARFFVNGMGVGFNGMVTVEAHKISFLRGPILYVTAFLQAMRKHFHKPELQLTIDEKPTVAIQTLALSINIAMREGGFPINWNAIIDDGFFDLFHVKNLQRWQVIRYLPALLSGNLPHNHNEFSFTKARYVKVSSKTPLCIHTDGELAVVPSDQITDVRVELLPKCLNVQFCPNGLYETRD